MDRELIIRLAREAGLWNLITKYTKVTAGKNANPEDLIWSDVERFAALVAAAEREACAKVCEAFGKTLEVDVGDCFAEEIRGRT